MSKPEYHFNVYLADFRWIWVGEFWAGDNQGIEEVGAQGVRGRGHGCPKRLSY